MNNPLHPFELVVVDYPESDNPFVEVWLNDVLLCSIEGAHPDLPIRFYPARQETMAAAAQFESVLRCAINRARQLAQPL